MPETKDFIPAFDFDFKPFFSQDKTERDKDEAFIEGLDFEGKIKLANRYSHRDLPAIPLKSLQMVSHQGAPPALRFKHSVANKNPEEIVKSLEKYVAGLQEEGQEPGQVVMREGKIFYTLPADPEDINEGLARPIEYDPEQTAKGFSDEFQRRVAKRYREEGEPEEGFTGGIKELGSKVVDAGSVVGDYLSQPEGTADVAQMLGVSPQVAGGIIGAIMAAPQGGGNWFTTGLRTGLGGAAGVTAVSAIQEALDTIAGDKDFEDINLAKVGSDGLNALWGIPIDILTGGLARGLRGYKGGKEIYKGLTKIHVGEEAFEAMSEREAAEMGVKLFREAKEELGPGATIGQITQSKAILAQEAKNPKLHAQGLQLIEDLRQKGFGILKKGAKGETPTVAPAASAEDLARGNLPEDIAAKAGASKEVADQAPFRKRLNELMEEYSQAEAAGDVKRMKALEKEAHEISGGKLKTYEQDEIVSVAARPSKMGEAAKKPKTLSVEVEEVPESIARRKAPEGPVSKKASRVEKALQRQLSVLEDQITAGRAAGDATGVYKLEQKKARLVKQRQAIDREDTNIIQSIKEEVGTRNKYRRDLARAKRNPKDNKQLIENLEFRIKDKNAQIQDLREQAAAVGKQRRGAKKTEAPVEEFRMPKAEPAEAPGPEGPPPLKNPREFTEEQAKDFTAKGNPLDDLAKQEEAIAKKLRSTKFKDLRPMVDDLLKNDSSEVGKRALQKVRAELTETAFGSPKTRLVPGKKFKNKRMAQDAARRLAMTYPKEFQEPIIKAANQVVEYQNMTPAAAKSDFIGKIRKSIKDATFRTAANTLINMIMPGSSNFAPKAFGAFVRRLFSTAGFNAAKKAGKEVIDNRLPKKFAKNPKALEHIGAIITGDKKMLGNITLGGLGALHGAFPELVPETRAYVERRMEEYLKKNNIEFSKEKMGAALDSLFAGEDADKEEDDNE